MLGPLSSYFFGDQLFRFDMWKEDRTRLQVTFVVLTPSWSNIIIFQYVHYVQYNLSLCSILNICLLCSYEHNEHNYVHMFIMFNIIFHYDLVMLFFPPIWSLTCLVWICTITIFKKIDTTYKNVGFGFNLEQISTNSRKALSI